MQTRDELLDGHLEEVRSRIRNNKASETDWLFLILNRQCEKLDSMADKVDRIVDTILPFERDRNFAINFLKRNWFQVSVLLGGGTGIGLIVDKIN